MRNFFGIAAVVLAMSAVADSKQPHVYPFAPTSVTPVEVHFNSRIPTNGYEVSRNGSLIRVTMLGPNRTPAVPFSFPEIVRLPDLLPPGEYRVEVRYEDAPATIVAETEFVVRNGARPPFEIHPFAVLDVSAGLRLRISGVNCSTSDCSDVTVRIDGTVAGPLKRASDGSIWFTAPPHAKGLVDVTVEQADFVQVSPAALYYFDHADRSVFERILFPVVSSTRGALGSEWVSEAAISNPKPWFVENANKLESGIVCITYPCGERISPGGSGKFSMGHPRGIALHVPRPEAPSMAFALRVRDVSRDAEGLGTRIPVVREQEFFHGTTLTLLDVPIDPRYRVKVRIYALEPFDVTRPFGRVVIRQSDNQVRESRPYQLTRAEGESSSYYAEVDLTPGAAGARRNVYVEPPLDGTIWAFATVTNNETQQVTIVTPNGRGGPP